MTDKKCETCEQRWLLTLYSTAIEEITISHETPETITKYTDRGPLGASTHRMAKRSNYYRVYKTEIEAVTAAYEHAAKKADNAREMYRDWESTRDGLGTRLAKLHVQQTAS